MINIVHFKISGKFAHFLHAETNVCMPSYPIPPRTVLLGIMGAVLGLDKDKPQEELEPASIAVKGKLPQSFWVCNKFHQSLPKPLSYRIKKTEKGSDSDLKNQKRLTQQWLFKPEYEVFVSLPDRYHSRFSDRVKKRKWFFSPCLGISEHMADINWISDQTTEFLQKGEHLIGSIFPTSAGEINMKSVFKSENPLTLHFIRMPAKVNIQRIFSHEEYCFERNGYEIPLYTDKAIRVNGTNIIFM